MNESIWLQAQDDSIFTPCPQELRGTVYPDMSVQLYGKLEGSERPEYFWVTVTQRDGDRLIGMVASNLCFNKVTGQTIAFHVKHIVSMPILWPPFGMKICEIQICAMHSTEDGWTLADSESPPLEVNGYDVLVRYCDVWDNQHEPSDILHFDDFSFDDYADAGIFADYLQRTYTPDIGVEEI